MKSVCTMAISLVVAGAATTGSLFAQSGAYGRYTSPGMVALPESGLAFRTAQNDPAENYPTVPREDDSVLQAPPAPTVDDEVGASDDEAAAPAAHANGCTSGCTTGCNEGCTSGCDTGCDKGCTTECNAGCATGCDKGCASGCDSGCNDVISSPWHDDCDDCASELPSCCDCNPWFASAAGLIMTSDNPNRMWTSYDADNPPNQIGNTRDIDLDWTGGVEIRVGKCNCDNGWEAIYWGVYGLDGELSITHPDGVSTPIDVGLVDIGPDDAEDFFDNSAEHRLRRDNDFHNVEINYIHNMIGCGPQSCNCCNPLSVSFLAGFRYFRFDEDLAFIGVREGSTFDVAADRAHLDIELEQDLWGFQIGGRADYRAGSRLNLYASPKVGVFANDVDSRAHLYRGDLAFEAFDIQGSERDVAIMAQIDLGLEYMVTPNWKVFGGYRALAITGVALADEQIPPFLVDAPAFEDVDTNGSLILHGAFGGLEYRF